jgi:hypothetical protein
MEETAKRKYAMNGEKRRDKSSLLQMMGAAKAK